MPSQRFIESASHPEHLLIMMLVRAQTTPQDDAQVRDLVSRQPIDWERVIHTANQHGVLSLCSGALKALALPQLPPAQLTRITHAVRQVAMRNLEMTKELTRLAPMFMAKDIPLLCYKGPTLAALVYGGVGARQFGDLDLLVPQDRLITAKAILTADQYIPISSIEHRSEQQDDKDRSYQGYDLIRADQRVAIDLQMRFGLRYSSFSLDFDSLWARRQTLYFGDHAVFTPSLEDYFLILCAHGTQHRWGQLKWICDIARMLTASLVIDWERVAARADAMHSTRMVHIALILAHETFDAPLPDLLRERVLADRTARRLAYQIYLLLFRHESGFAYLVARARLDYTFDLAVRGALRDKLACFIFLTRRRLAPNHTPAPD